MGSVLGSLGAFQGNIWSVAPFIPVEDWEGPKISILPWWNFFDWGPSPDLYDNFNKIGDGVFTKTSQELRMLSSVTINYQVTKIVMNSGSQLSEL